MSRTGKDKAENGLARAWDKQPCGFGSEPRKDFDKRLILATANRPLQLGDGLNEGIC
ncbi:hypothetical protein CFL01nite_16660 [Corynebacterium flavescens]|uniref:ATPase AAA-type core domain-containing protein n=1 Tax=Corynebacterium flavescens TaxID=28028 RepID=A0AB73B8B5_CORFL|nr:hypothetical protein CFL01nite_16660 [Corynebacterium flavescens]